MCVAFFFLLLSDTDPLQLFLFLGVFSGQKKNTTQWHCVSFRRGSAGAMQTRGIKRKVIGDAEEDEKDESDEDYACPDSSSEESDSGSENPTESEDDGDEDHEDAEEDLDDEDEEDEEEDDGEDEEDGEFEEDEEQNITATEREPVSGCATGSSIS